LNNKSNLLLKIVRYKKLRSIKKIEKELLGVRGSFVRSGSKFKFVIYDSKSFILLFIILLTYNILYLKAAQIFPIVMILIALITLLLNSLAKYYEYSTHLSSKECKS
jgi:hypothetical protein